ncbi:MAG: hypothetical protein ISS34_04235 [Candidatus Omnitrophica bacterium]|nr:hypothetical protein [Candidatus Omnitrophota bacterium]
MRGRNFVLLSLMLCACIIVIAGCSKEKLEEKVKLDLPEEELELIYTEEESEELVGISSLQRGEWRSFAVYVDNGYFRNNFIPSGWMGDYGDMKFNPNWKDNVHSRKSCIRIEYTAEAKQGNRWAGIYWQNPENNWGMREGGGFDLEKAAKLTFWARGEKGGEAIREFKMGGISGAYPDTDTASIGPVTLTQEWQQYTIDLTELDLSYIIGGFAWVASALDNPDGMVFYLDDIIYE